MYQSIKQINKPARDCYLLLFSNLIFYIGVCIQLDESKLWASACLLLLYDSLILLWISYLVPLKCTNSLSSNLLK